MGDRECPNCGQMSLIEKGLTKWKCLNPNCNEEYTEEELDAGIEIDDEE